MCITDINLCCLFQNECQFDRRGETSSTTAFGATTCQSSFSGGCRPSSGSGGQPLPGCPSGLQATGSSAKEKFKLLIILKQREWEIYNPSRSRSTGPDRARDKVGRQERRLTAEVRQVREYQGVMDVPTRSL